MTTKIFHITHNDGDAVGCAVLLNLYFRDIEDTILYTEYCSYNNISDKIEEVVEEIEQCAKYAYPIVNYILVISDISPAKGSEGYNILKKYLLLENMSSDTNKVKVWMFDHHITNPFKDMMVRDDCINIVKSGDTNHKTSAAEVMFNYLFDNYSVYDSSKDYSNINFSLALCNDIVKKFIIDISRYDTWEWRENPSEDQTEDAVSNVLRYVPIDILVSEITDFIDAKINEPTSDLHPDVYLPDKYVAMNELVKSEFNKYMDSINYKLKLSSSGEYVYGLLLCDNTSINMSLVTDIINRDILPRMLDYIVILFPSTRNLSFRTIMDTVDVSRLTKRCYGGGGHQKAAGARVDIPTFTSFLNEYWLSPSVDNIVRYYNKPTVELTPDMIIEYIHLDENED